MLARRTSGLVAKAARCASTIPACPPTRLTTLDNGLRVASEDGYGQIATVGVWIDTGSRYETAETNGVAHFLEHMAFKGTSQRSQGDIESQLENMGGHLNAYTSREQTVYFAKVFKDDVTKAVDILADIIQRSTYAPEAIEMERGTIIREGEEVATMKDEVVFDLLHQTAFPDSSLGRTILGPDDNIRSISRDNLVDYVRTHYTTPRMVVVGAGAVDHDALCSLADKAFADLPTTPPSGDSVVLPPAVYQGSQVLLSDDDMPVAHVTVGVEGVGWSHPDSIPVLVLQTILGHWDRAAGNGTNVASALCREVAERGYVHSITTFNTVYKDTSLFGNYFVTTPDNCDNAINAIQNNWMRLCFNPTAEEVTRAKNALKAQALMNLDNSNAVAEDIGRQVLCYGRRLPAAEIFARIDAVDVNTIKRVATEYFYDKEPVSAAVGAGVQHVPDINWLRGGMTWWRV